MISATDSVVKQTINSIVPIPASFTVCSHSNVSHHHYLSKPCMMNLEPEVSKVNRGRNILLLIWQVSVAAVN
jgi:hypothetical protein